MRCPSCGFDEFDYVRNECPECGTSSVGVSFAGEEQQDDEEPEEQERELSLRVWRWQIIVELFLIVGSVVYLTWSVWQVLGAPVPDLSLSGLLSAGIHMGVAFLGVLLGVVLLVVAAIVAYVIAISINLAWESLWLWIDSKVEGGRDYAGPSEPDLDGVKVLNSDGELVGVEVVEQTGDYTYLLEPESGGARFSVEASSVLDVDDRTHHQRPLGDDSGESR